MFSYYCVTIDYHKKNLLKTELQQQTFSDNTFTNKHTTHTLSAFDGGVLLGVAQYHPSNNCQSHLIK